MDCSALLQGKSCYEPDNVISHATYAFDSYYHQMGKAPGTCDFNGVVGDITIVAHRTDWVDFTFPYSESGWCMVVPITHDKYWNMWTFLKPFSWDLWLTTLGACIFTGLVIRLIEHRVNSEFRGPYYQQLGLVFWFPFQSVVFHLGSKSPLVRAL